MKATEILSEEHVVILRAITALETATNRLESRQGIQAEFFLDTADFIKGFADGCHHRKEEGVLFQSMAANGVPVQNGPIGAMLADHEQGRAYTRGMREAAQRLQAGDDGAAAVVIENARGYAGLLRTHIYKEDNILFPMADRAIPVSQQAQVFDDFEKVEHEETGEGVHEKYLALAEKLESLVK
jgi:hemerythrin-like domain-containing protein